MKSRVLGAAATLVLCVGCACTTTTTSPTPTSAVTQAPQATSSTQPTASAATSVSASDLIAIAKQIYPYSSQFNYYTVCGVNGDLSQCPVTERLKAFLTQRQTTLCGCQNPASSLDVTADATSNGGVAHVLFGPQPTGRKFDLIIVSQGGRLLVDDQLCTGGGPSTSIYVRTGNC